jgi:hypothetical protein
MLLLARQTGQRRRSELLYVDADSPYMQWMSAAGLEDDVAPSNPVELPLGMYYPETRCNKPPCGCCGSPYEFVQDPADTPTPEQEIIDTYKLPADEVNLYKKAWNSFDGRRAGRIPGVQGVAKLARMLGTNPRPSDLKYALGLIDPEGKGIDYPDFLLMMARHAPSWPVAISESLSIPMSEEKVRIAESDIKRALATAVDVQPDKVSIVRVRPAPGGSGSIVDVNIDGSTDDMMMMKKMLTTDAINQQMAKVGLPNISKGPDTVRAVESLTLPQSASSLTEDEQQNMKAAIAGLIRKGLEDHGFQPGSDEDVSIVRIQGVNGRPEQASVDIGIEAEDENQFSVVKAALEPSALGAAFQAVNLPAPTGSNIVVIPNGFTPGCMSCMGLSPYMDGDDLGKDWVGNAPFDRPLSRYQAEEVHRFDSDKPICQCDDDRR